MADHTPLVTTALSCVDGVHGVLALRGVRLEDAVTRPWLDVAALLLDERAPDAARGIDRRLCSGRWPAAVDAVLAASAGLAPMARLRALAAMLDGDGVDDLVWTGLLGRLVARLRRPDPATSDADGGYVRTILRGVVDADAPIDDDDVEVLGACFVVHVDHALNPGTLAVRVAASTGASLSACFCAGLGALEGPLHGGASTAVGALLDGIASPADVDGALAALAAAKRRVPGFGHPVYRQRDPRAAVLRALCERAAAHRHEHRFVDVAVRVDERVRERSGGRLFPNVDFYAAALYATLGVPLQLHTPLFFAARAIGWLAHVREQRARGRVISPDAGYDGPPLEAAPTRAASSTPPSAPTT
jgi:citrate synthase